MLVLNGVSGVEQRDMNVYDWTVEQAIKERVEKEDIYQWAMRPTPPLVNNYKPQRFELTETAKHVFGSAVHLVNIVNPWNA